MNVKKTILIAALALILLLVSGFVYYYQPAYVHLDLHGAEVAEDGSILVEGTLQIYGFRLTPRSGGDQAGQFYPLHSCFPGTERKLDRSQTSYVNSGSNWLISGVWWELSDPYHLSIRIGSENDWCLAHFGDGHFYVGANNADTDLSEIFQTHIASTRTDEGPI